MVKNSLIKDLILREGLAFERTDMAIDRALLSFIRTSLYFIGAGMTVTSLLKISYGWWVEILFWVLGIAILIFGVYRSGRQKKKLKDAQRHIGNYQLEWEDDVE